MSFFTVGSKEKYKNQHSEYQGISIHIQKSGLLKTWKSHFSLVWVMEFTIISPCLGKGKRFYENSNLINLVDTQRLPDNGKWIIPDGVCTLFKKTFLPFHTAALKCFIYSGVKISQIFHGAINPVTPTKNYVKVAPTHLIRKKLPFFQVIFYLPTTVGNKELVGATGIVAPWKISDTFTLTTSKIMLT